MRTVFFISDGTGITAEALGRSLLSQFSQLIFEFITIPYINTRDKAEHALARIDQANKKDGVRPIVFTTLVNSEVNQLLQKSSALIVDFFQKFISPLEAELGHQSSHTVGLSHGVKNYNEYMKRINAVNYAIAYDDGLNASGYDKADVILIGVSRCGKTPSCIYLALQFGIFAANYPLAGESLEQFKLPQSLVSFTKKLFGLTIDPERLQKIRQERFPNRKYAMLQQCETEVEHAENLFKEYDIPFLDTSSRSIEEIAAEIMTIGNLKRRLY